MTNYIISEKRCTNGTDILFVIGFSIFVLSLFIGEVVVLIYLTKHGYIDNFMNMISINRFVDMIP